MSHENTGWATFRRALEQRSIYLGGAIDDDVANVVIAQLLFLESEDRHAPIWIYINSPGGQVAASLAICDVMTSITPDVGTMVLRQASGTALMIAARGTPGRRFAAPDADLSLTQIVRGRPDTDDAALARTSAIVYGFLAQDTGQTAATIAGDSHRGLRFSSREAIAYGLIDEVFSRSS